MALLASTTAWLVDYNIKRKERRNVCPKHGLVDLKTETRQTSETSPDLKKQKSNQKVEDTKLVDGENAVIRMNRSVLDIIAQEFDDEDEEDFSSPLMTLSQSLNPTRNDSQAEDDEDESDECTCLPFVRLYYCTRTHKQISQVVKEYSRLPYAYINKLRHTILASRVQSCVNEEVRNMGGDLNRHCMDLLKSKTLGKGAGCRYREPLTKRYERKGTLRTEMSGKVFEAWDIETITEALRHGKNAMCPYFATTRYFTMDADIVFCPFNYLLDPIIRNSSDVHLRHSVVILDEAHNIEDVCRDSASFSFTETELATAMHDFKTKLAKLSDAKEFVAQTLGHDEGPTAEYITSLENSVVEMRDFLKWFFKIFSDLVDRTRSGRSSFQQPASLNLDWQHTFLLFEKVSQPQFPSELKLLMKSFEVIAGKGNEATQTNATTDLNQFLPTQLSVVCVEKILYFLYFYQKDNNRTYYKCNVNIERVRTQQNDFTVDTDVVLNYMVPGHNVTMNLWCMLPSVCATDAFAPCRSVILASGTLHPIDSFSTELGMDFKFQMEGDQLIDSSRIFATGLPWGPTNKTLKLTYREMESDAGIKVELARLVFDVCRVVPKGVLVFLPSYRMLDDLMTSLEKSGLMSHLRGIKDVYVEPKVSMDMVNVQENYERSAVHPTRGKTGALMLAVFRGKVSEGIDFADDKARCVISVGIPFPNLKDEQVGQKRTFNDSNSKFMSLLSGSEWYSMQAFRALNQALGRCLRHQHDWGALILVDERFQCPQPKISKWVRQRMVKFPQYARFRESLVHFVERHTSSAGVEQKPEVEEARAIEQKPSTSARKPKNFIFS